jgi:hypothetical protein
MKILIYKIDWIIIINSLKIMTTLFCKIPPNLLRPFVADGPKGGIMPLFGKEGGGEIFSLMSIQL